MLLFFHFSEHIESMKHILYHILIWTFISPFYGQQSPKKYQIRTIAFYNLENLFDTINNPNTFDEQSPILEFKGNKTKAYFSKLTNLATVIADIGFKKTRTSPAIIGVAEVENRSVLKDLIASQPLADKQYGIIHFDSPDRRGIDVALLYQKQYFKIIDQKKYELYLWDEKGARIFTRDQLLVSGVLDGELIYIIVNHWPSRRGGEVKSSIKREKAARLTKRIILDIYKETPQAKIIIMGDLNDDPNNKSLKEVLKAEGDIHKIRDTILYNPMEKLFKRGFNTLGYRDNINLFDQILTSSSLITRTKLFDTYKLFSTHIYNPKYIITPTGSYKGYPFRSYSNGVFTGGYSDHYPVYIYLIKEDK